MKRQIGQMNRVIDDLVDATRWACGKMTIQKQRLDVRDTVRDAALDVQAALAGRGLELAVATTSEPLWADADPQRLRKCSRTCFATPLLAASHRARSA
jgi:signal transduction histidine kinase